MNQGMRVMFLLFSFLVLCVDANSPPRRRRGDDQHRRRRRILTHNEDNEAESQPAHDPEIDEKKVTIHDSQISVGNPHPEKDEDGSGTSSDTSIGTPILVAVAGVLAVTIAWLMCRGSESSSYHYEESDPGDGFLEESDE